jgi:two-component sensor histidine kinase
VRPIAVNVDIANILLRSDEAVAIGMVVNELVTNPFKHAFPDDRAGTVTVTLQRTTVNELTLVVEDDGKGCSDNGGESFGSRIVRLLVQQLSSTEPSYTGSVSLKGGYGETALTHGARQACPS